MKRLLIRLSDSINRNLSRTLLYVFYLVSGSFCLHNLPGLQRLHKFQQDSFRELFDLLSGIQSGSISIEMLPAPEKEEEEEQEEEVSLESEASEEEKIVKGADHALEREEDLYEEEN